MSSDERFLALVAQALLRAGLEAIVVGGTAAVLQGAPIMTQDVDLLLRDTPRNREKLRELARLLGASVVQPNPASPELVLVGPAVPIDVLFDALPGRLGFASIRSRASELLVEGARLCVASLEDVIRSKEAADRPKDRAQLPVLRQTLRVRRALADQGRHPPADEVPPSP